jgi:hypothetical protein
MPFRKKQEQPNQSIVLNPGINQQDEFSSQIYNQPERTYTQDINQNQPQLYQQSQQIQQQPQQIQPMQVQPIQQKQQFNAEAIIIQGFITEENTYKYLVETNYPLKLGECSLTQ